MGIINVKIDDDTETAFRIEFIKRFGSKKGIMGQAVDEALRNWIHRLGGTVRLPVWVRDIPEEKADEFIARSEDIYKKLKYFKESPVERKEEGYVGIYYYLRPGEEP